MFLTKEEAISIILIFAKTHKISSKTKLNKLLARLNLFMIPIDIDFDLNKFGSYCSDLKLEGTDLYDTFSYQWKGEPKIGLRLSEKGHEMAEDTIRRKIKKILTDTELTELRETIYSLSELPADQISEEEHKDLLVDEDDRHRLINRINTVHIDLLDLYEGVKNMGYTNPAEVRFSALVEYCYYLTKYLKEVRFKSIETAGYDYEANMFDYYFLYILEKNTIPFLQSQLEQKQKDTIQINKHYQYFVNVVRSRYPFSLDNPDLKELVI